MRRTIPILCASWPLVLLACATPNPDMSAPPTPTGTEIAAVAPAAPPAEPAGRGGEGRQLPVARGGVRRAGPDLGQGPERALAQGAGHRGADRPQGAAALDLRLEGPHPLRHQAGQAAVQLLARRETRAGPAAADHPGRLPQEGVPAGRPCSTSTPSPRRRRRTGSTRAAPACARNTSAAWCRCLAGAATRWWCGSSTPARRPSSRAASPCPRPSRRSPGRTRTPSSWGPTSARARSPAPGYPRIAKEWKRGTPLAEASPSSRGRTATWRWAAAGTGTRGASSTSSSARSAFTRVRPSCSRRASRSSSTGPATPTCRSSPTSCCCSSAATGRWGARPGRRGPCWPPI